MVIKFYFAGQLKAIHMTTKQKIGVILVILAALSIICFLFYTLHAQWWLMLPVIGVLLFWELISWLLNDEE